MEPYERLERDWAKWNDLDPACMVVCSSGTAALHLGLAALGLPPDRGLEVLVPEYSMVACARAVSLAGLVPRFIDCGEDLLIDPQELGPVIGTRAQAVMPVHIYGRCCDMDAIHEVAEWQNLYVIEDLAEAHGIKPDPRTDVACWSFYRNKIIAGEEGGAVYFRNQELATEARALRNLGMSSVPGVHPYYCQPGGSNYRLANALAEKVLASLRSEGDRQAARGASEGWYDEACPAEWRMPPRDVVWVYDFKVPKPLDAVKVQTLMHDLPDLRPGFYPLSMLPEYANRSMAAGLAPRARYEGGTLASLLYKRILYLPVPAASRQGARLAFEALRAILGQ